MKLVFTLFLGIWALFSFSSCSGLMEELRSESAAIDREAGDDVDSDADDAYAYRQKSLRGLSANNVQSYEPPVVRGYGRRLAGMEEGARSAVSDANNSASAAYRRVTRQDFVDRNPGENSLWDSQGQGNFLFAHNRMREAGDLVTADVERELKREIQYQLWMTLPPHQRKVKRTPAGEEEKKDGEEAPKESQTAKSTDQKNRDDAEEAAKTNLASTGKDDDVVRMEVAENVGNGLVRVVGQKRVIYRGQARVVEVMALVNNKDIDDNNRVKSSAFLDMKTQVIQ